MGYQQTVIVGFLGRDAELRYTANGSPVCNFSVAVSEKWNNSKGEPQEETIWFKATLWGERGERLREYLVKGKQVMVIGKVKANGYKTNDGEVAASLDLTVRELQLLGGKNGERQDGFEEPETSSEDIPF